MAAKAKDTDLLKSYRVADSEERFSILMDNYAVFPKVIRKAQKKTEYKIKAEREYLRSHSRGELGVRVQTSKKSDTTVEEAIANVTLEEAFATGKVENIIHSKAGLSLRFKCNCIMRAQGHEEPTGKAKITPAYNLPCKYVIHTVGPIVQGSLTKRHEELLASCYRSCLDIAEENNVESIALCCISTGVFMFPNQRAAEIAVDTVKAWLAETGSQMKVVFNVYKDLDLEIYSELLQ